jgi:hypothetical protein
VRTFGQELDGGPVAARHGVGVAVDVLSGSSAGGVSAIRRRSFDFHVGEPFN